jgi:hypothetical protein
MQVLISSGIFPVSWFEFKDKFTRFSNFPILEGIEPTRLLKLRSITVSEEQSPMSKGIVPVRLESEMTSLVR